MKRTRAHGLVWVALIFLIQGCALGQVLDVATDQDISQVQKSRVYPKSYDAVWAATVKSLSVVLPINPPAVTHKVATTQSGRRQNSI